MLLFLLMVFFGAVVLWSGSRLYRLLRDRSQAGA
ncbi:MAG: hypothetical protein H6R21_373 [Proteobacteria bacterium]|nr:hypothetical protein [Pseudomonadota bacterium]